MANNFRRTSSSGLTASSIPSLNTVLPEPAAAISAGLEARKQFAETESRERKAALTTKMVQGGPAGLRALMEFRTRHPEDYLHAIKVQDAMVDLEVKELGIDRAEADRITLDFAQAAFEVSKIIDTNPEQAREIREAYERANPGSGTEDLSITEFMSQGIPAGVILGDFNENFKDAREHGQDKEILAEAARVRKNEAKREEDQLIAKENREEARTIATEKQEAAAAKEQALSDERAANRKRARDERKAIRQEKRKAEQKQGETTLELAERNLADSQARQQAGDDSPELQAKIDRALTNVDQLSKGGKDKGGFSLAVGPDGSVQLTQGGGAKPVLTTPTFHQEAVHRMNEMNDGIRMVDDMIGLIEGDPTASGFSGSVNKFFQEGVGITKDLAEAFEAADNGAMIGVIAESLNQGLVDVGFGESFNKNIPALERMMNALSYYVARARKGPGRISIDDRKEAAKDTQVKGFRTRDSILEKLIGLKGELLNGIKRENSGLSLEVAPPESFTGTSVPGSPPDTGVPRYRIEAGQLVRVQ